MTHRPALRAAARAAMAQVPAFTGWTAPRSWSQALDLDALPMWAVTVADEQSAFAAKDTLRRDVQVTVTLRRAGGDAIEDALDADAALIEAAVWPALAAASLQAVLAESRQQIAGEGAKRIGQLDLRFSCVVFTETPV